MSRTFLIGGEVVAEDGPGFGERLATTRDRHERPLCLCRADGPPMYVARIGDRLLLKRMPMTGPKHDPDCPSYEPPPELSGRGEIEGAAIEEDMAAGLTRLKLAFSLSKRGSRNAVASTEMPKEAARTDGSKLSLRALLHYLWEEAELNHWSPGMAGRRSWAVVRRRLLDAAADKFAKGAPLVESLFIPETFAAGHKAELAARRADILRPLAQTTGRIRPLMVLIGEVKEIAAARFGHRLVVKHLPDLSLMLADDVFRRLKARFAAEIELGDAIAGARLVAIATFGRGPTGVASVDEIAVMATTEHWIPVEHLHDAELANDLARSGWRFIKGMRYNLARSRPLASAVLPATRPRPTALYVVPIDADATYRSDLEALVGASDLASWIWQTDLPRPALPGSPPRPTPSITSCLSRS